MCTRTINIWQMLLYKWKKSLGGVNVSPSTELYNYGTDIGMVAKDAQECENNKSYIICDNMFTRKINIWQILLYKWKKSLGGLTFPPLHNFIIKVWTLV